MSKEKGRLCFEGYEPNVRLWGRVRVSAMERARSLPPVNPWWSDKVKMEAILRSQRPEDLPAPADGDLDEEAAAVQDGCAAGSGKGRGAVSMSGSAGARLFTTPESARSFIEGPVTGRGRQTDGRMPASEGSSGPPTSMGPLPPQHQPKQKKHAEPGRDRENDLQRALEAEMVSFLREQNAQLQEQVEALKRQQQGHPASGPTSTPSSWEQVEIHKEGCMGPTSGDGGLGVASKGPHDDLPLHPKWDSGSAGFAASGDRTA